MQIYVFIIFSSIYFIFTEACYGTYAEPLLILNSENKDTYPLHFRASIDPVSAEGDFSQLNLKGLRELPLSGSAQFSLKGLEAVVRHLPHPDKILIIDLRQESHGFVNGNAVSWYAPRNWENKGKTLKEILSFEKNLLQNLQKQKEITIFQVLNKKNGLIIEKKAISLRVETVAQESEMAHLLKLEYLRLPITDHLRPKDEEVDFFVNLIQKLPSDTWLHLHCSAGDGRTTTFMAMVDMMKNSQIVSLEDIFIRQWLLGGIRLNHLPHPESWKYAMVKERSEFLTNFYLYCRESNPSFNETWSSYIKKT